MATTYNCVVCPFAAAVEAAAAAVVPVALVVDTGLHLTLGNNLPTLIPMLLYHLREAALIRRNC